MADKNTTNSNAYLAFDTDLNLLPIRLKEAFSPTYYDTNAFVSTGINTTTALTTGQTSMVLTGDVRSTFVPNVSIAFSNVLGSSLYVVASSTFDGTNTTVVFAPGLLANIALGTAIYTYGVVRSRYNDLVIGANMSATLSGNVLTLNSTGGGGGSSNPLVNLGTSFTADNSAIAVKVTQSSPQLTVNGSVGVVADFSSVTITSTWPPTVPAGYNRNYVFIADSTNLSWAGVGLINTTPAGIINIAWIKRPATAGAFTGAGVWYASDMVSTVFVGSSVANAVLNNSTMLVLPEPTITDLGAGSDTYGGPAKQITYQPFIDGRIAQQIGSAPLPPGIIFTNTNNSVGSYVSGVFPVNAPFTNLVSALLALGNGIVQNATGNWTLPPNPILIAVVASPTVSQYTRITQITQSAFEINIIVDTMNQSYFSGLTYPQTLFISLQRFTFQPPPQAEILRLAGTVIPSSGQTFAIRDDVTYACRDTSNNQFAGVLTSDRATATISFAINVPDGTTVTNIGITFTSSIPSSFVNGTPIITFGATGLFNITLSLLNVSGTTYTLTGELNTVYNTSVPAGTYSVVIAAAVNASSGNVRSLRNVALPGASQATWGWRVAGDTTNFTTQVLEAGSNITFDLDPLTSQPRISANIPINLGKGWIFSLDWFPNNFPSSAGWTGNQAIPRMLRNGTIIATTGINTAAYWGAVRNWVSGNPDIPDTQYVANQYAAWHNSFADSLTVSVTVEDASGRWQVKTTAPTSDPSSLISDATFKAMWNVNNSNGNFEHMSGIAYDDAGGTYLYQRAVGSTTIVSDTLQQVLNQGNTANNATGTPNNVGTIQLTDVSVSPNRSSSYSGSLTSTPSLQLTGQTSGNVTLNVPAAITSYTLTLPLVQGGTSQTLVNNGSGVLTWGNVGGSLQQVLNLGNTASTASGGVASFTLTNTTTNAVTTVAPDRVTTERIRLSAVGATGTVDLRNAGSSNIYTLTFPAAQSNNDTNFIGVNSSGQMSFTLPTIGNVVFSAWVNTGLNNIDQLAVGVETFNINGDVTSTLRAGDTISWSSAGTTRYLVEQVAFNAGTNLTNVLLLTPIVNVISGNAIIYKGTTDITSQRITALNIGTGLEGSFTNGILSIVNTSSGSGPGTVPSLDQVTAIGANSTRSISVQPAGFNGIGLIVPPTLAASPQIIVLGTATNAGLAIVTRGAGALLFGSSDITVNTESHVFTTGGVTLNIIPGTAGGTPIFTYTKQVSVYDAIGGTGVDIIGGANRAISASAGSNDLTVTSSGNGTLTLGNITNTAFQVTGGQTGSSILQVVGSAASINANIQAKSAGAVNLSNGLNTLTLSLTTTRISLSATGTSNCDLVFAPSGTGDLYPIGTALSGVAANQPTINVAAGAGLTNVGPGTAGQVLTSNGTSGSPYWGPGGGAPVSRMAIFDNSGSTSNIITSTFTLPLTTRVNNLGLTVSSNQISGFNGTYLVQLKWSFRKTSGTQENLNSYCSVINANGITSGDVGYGNGAAVSCIVLSSQPVGDFANSYSQAIKTGTTNLWAWAFIQSTAYGVSWGLQLIITKLD